MMKWLAPVTWLRNETEDMMFLSTINEFGSSEGREKVIPAGGLLVMRYRQGMDRIAKVRFKVRAEGRVDLENKEISPYTVFECSDINIRYKLADGSVVKNYEDGAFLDFDLEKGIGQVPRIGLFRWFRGCYDSFAAFGERCFAGQEANDHDDVLQGQARVIIHAAQAPNSPIPQPVICQVEAIPAVAAPDPPISQPHEMQHVINGEVETISAAETSNPPIPQSEIQHVNDVITGHVEAPDPPIPQPIINAEVMRNIVETQYPPISQPDQIQLGIGQVEVIVVDGAPDPPIPQLKIQHVINGEAHQAIRIPKAPDPQISRPEIQVINCQAEASDHPPIPQPDEIQYVIKGQAKAIPIADTSNPPTPQPGIRGQAEAKPVLEEAIDPPIPQPDEIQLVINCQGEAIFVAEAPDSPIPQLVIN